MLIEDKLKEKLSKSEFRFWMLIEDKKKEKLSKPEIKILDANWGLRRLFRCDLFVGK